MSEKYRNNPNYDIYLNSYRWDKLRQRILKRDNHKCLVCGCENKKLHVHHLTYDRFTHEDMDDLVTLCEDCHNKVHDIISAYAPNGIGLRDEVYIANNFPNMRYDGDLAWVVVATAMNSKLKIDKHGIYTDKISHIVAELTCNLK